MNEVLLYACALYLDAALEIRGELTSILHRKYKARLPQYCTGDMTQDYLDTALEIRGKMTSMLHWRYEARFSDVAVASVCGNTKNGRCRLTGIPLFTHLCIGGLAFKAHRRLFYSTQGPTTFYDL